MSLNPALTTHNRQTGLSLVELMISLTIGLVLLLGISTLIVQQNQARSEMDKSSRQIENGRYAMQLLHDDIQLAGFYDGYSPASGVAINTPDSCLTTDNTANLATTGNMGWINNATATYVPVPIYGYAAAATDPTPSSCLNNYLPNTPVLVLRRASTSDPIPAASAVAANAIAVASGVEPTTYLQVSKCDTVAKPFVLGTSGYTLLEKDCTTTAKVRPYIVRTYYISRCSGTTCTATAADIPTLKVEEFVNGARTTVPLVDGIENIQFEYGIDTNGDGGPDSFASAPLSTNWRNVMAVRLHILARNNETTAGYVDTKTYDLAGSSVSPGGAYKRHVYTQLVRANNPSGRRE